MSVGNMRGLVRDYGLQHVRPLHFIEQTVMDKDRIIADNKCI